MHSSGESFQYGYDAIGNRLVYTRTLAAQSVTTYTYDAANRLKTAKASGDPNPWYYTLFALDCSSGASRFKVTTVPFYRDLECAIIVH